eukprot:8886270-Pyramimonas_sp.AAC.1
MIASSVHPTAQSYIQVSCLRTCERGWLPPPRHTAAHQLTEWSYCCTTLTILSIIILAQSTVFPYPARGSRLASHPGARQRIRPSHSLDIVSSSRASAPKPTRPLFPHPACGVRLRLLDLTHRYGCR